MIADFFASDGGDLIHVKYFRLALSHRSTSSREQGGGMSVSATKEHGENDPRSLDREPGGAIRMGGATLRQQPTDTGHRSGADGDVPWN